MTVHQFSAKQLDGEMESLTDYKGKVLLIVNTASKCGLTPQYEGLQDLYLSYKEQGLEVLGFPCNQFGQQEPGSEEDIASFCSTNYHVTFPMFAKIDVNGPNAHPLYQYLKQQAPGEGESSDIQWNFTKFLIDQYGNVVRRFEPQVTPAELEPYIAELM